MTRILFLLTAILITLASCHREAWHWVTPQPHPTHIAPRVAPPTPTLPSLPTVTPTPQVEYKCHRYKVVECEFDMKVGEL